MRCCLLLLLAAAPAFAGPGRSLIELAGPAGAVRGRLECRTDAAAYLLTPGGTLEAVPLAGVSSFRRVAPVFRADPAAVVASRLKAEVGRGGAVFRTRRWVVARHAARTPGTYGAELERIHQGVSAWFARRGTRLPEPEFPLVAVVLPDFPSFAKVAAADGVASSPGRVPRAVKGYYSPTSNRLILWEGPGGPADAGFRSTLTHEAVHQICHNTGLHGRTGGSPRWAVEGLATVLEVPAALAGGRVALADKANPSRLARFRRTRHTPGYLDRLVSGPAGDDLVHADPRAFYADAWALTFFLTETRGPRYARYLGRLGEKTAADPDDPAARRADFRAAFAADPSDLEGEMEAWIAGL